jgi:antirestriction protein
MRIYVACLASYNNGVLHGAWIDAVADKDAMQDEVNAILRASKFPNVTVEHDGQMVPSAEEYAIHDYDEFPNLGEYPGLQAVADIAELIEQGEERGLSVAVVEGVIDHYGQGYLECARDAIENEYAGVFDDLEDYAAEITEECGHLENVPEHVRNYIDYKAMARDMTYNGEIFTIEEGGKVHVFWNR